MAEPECESSSSNSVLSVLCGILMEFSPPVGKRPERCQRWGPGLGPQHPFGDPRGPNEMRAKGRLVLT